MGLLFAWMGAVHRADAQTTAGGLFRPWPGTQAAESNPSITLQNAGHIKGGEDGVHLMTFESEGRWRLNQKYKLAPTLGYSARSIHFHSDSPLLPESLTDVSFGFGTPLKQFDTGWFMAASGAVGYAGDAAFSDSAAWYGRGTLLFGKQLGKDQMLLLGVDYDGNRTILPDIPLPGIAWSARLDPTLQAAIGFPYNSVFWQPRPDVRVDFYYTIPSLFRLKIGYNPVHDVLLFTELRNTFSAYHVKDYPSDRRLFFEDTRLEAGVRWQPYKLLGVTAAIGYAFGQELHRGFDSRSLHSVAKLSDEPYLRFALEWKY